jgi:hypothetical protein
VQGIDLLGDADRDWAVLPPHCRFGYVRKGDNSHEGNVSYEETLFSRDLSSSEIESAASIVMIRPPARPLQIERTRRTVVEATAERLGIPRSKVESENRLGRGGLHQRLKG